MTYYIHPVWFYLMNLSDTIKYSLFAISIGGLIILLIAFAIYMEDSYLEDLTANARKIMKRIIIAVISIFILACLIPDKTTCTEMMIASQVTHENVKAAKEEVGEVVKDIIDYAKEFNENEEE